MFTKSYSKQGTYTANGRIDTPNNIKHSFGIMSYVKELILLAGMVYAAVQIVPLLVKQDNMNTLFIAKEANGRQWIVGTAYAANILRAQAYFIKNLSQESLQIGVTIHDTGLLEDSPEARLMIAIYGDDES